MPPGHQSKRGLTEQKQTKENATFELTRFSNRSFSKRSQRAQSTQGSKGHARFNLQSQEGPSANQQRVKRSSSFFATPVPIVTIVAAGVLPAGHRGLPVGLKARLGQRRYIRPLLAAPSPAPPASPCLAALRRTLVPGFFFWWQDGNKDHGRNRAR